MGTVGLMTLRRDRTMSESEIKIEFQLTEAEYLAATRLYYFRSRNLLMRMIVFAVLALIVAGMISLLADVFIWAMVVIIILFIGWVFYNVLVQMPRRYFRGDGKFHGKHEMTFSDNGIFLKTAQLESKVAWDLYTKVIEGRDLYGLIYGRETRMMTIVPKRAFKSRSEELRFRELMAGHISDKSGLKIPSEEPEFTPKSFTPPDWR
jgi:hypothetical protein